MNKYLLLALSPFINEDEIFYYSQLDEDILTHLIALSPFVNNAKQLKELSKLSVEKLAKVSEKLPLMDSNEIDCYFENLDC